jgi:8-oxo-dGTP diphosphatase
VDQDTPLREAIVNEWRDELGVKLEAGDIIMIGEAPVTKRHPQTLHIIFEALEIRGTPKIRPGNTHSLDIAWVPIVKLGETPLYPDVGRQLYDCLKTGPQRSLEFIGNCMERGFW